MLPYKLLPRKSLLQQFLQFFNLLSLTLHIIVTKTVIIILTIIFALSIKKNLKSFSISTSGYEIHKMGVSLATKKRESLDSQRVTTSLLAVTKMSDLTRIMYTGNVGLIVIKINQVTYQSIKSGS